MGKSTKPVAVILGCSTGTGAACMRAFADAGYHVIGFHLGRHPKDANAVGLHLMESGADGSLVTMDAGSTHEAVVQAVDHIAYLGEVNVLIHALSGASIGSTIGTAPKNVERTFNLMAHSFFWWTQQLLAKDLLVPYSALFALTNPLPQYYLNGSGVVGPAKAALETYVKHLAVELGSQQISVNAVRFSTVLTPALSKVLGDEGVQRMARLHRRIMPHNVMQEADHVAEFIRRLVQFPDRPTGAVLDYTTGATLTLLDYAFRG